MDDPAKIQVPVGADLPEVEGEVPKLADSLKNADMTLVYAGTNDDKKVVGASQVFDCVILTIFAEQAKGKTIRAMAHYNVFAKHQAEKIITAFLDKVRELEPDPKNWTATLSYKADRPTDYVTGLYEIVIRAVPNVAITKRKFTTVLPEISVFMAPDGQLSAAGSGVQKERGKIQIGRGTGR